MTHRFAILIDGAFYFRMISRKLKHPPTADEVEAETFLIRNHRLLTGYELLRIYYYDAYPATNTTANPISGRKINLGNTDVFKRNHAFLQALELKENFALRIGELSFQGWELTNDAMRDPGLAQRQLKDEDFKPNIEQKGVDLRIGLDIARLALRNIAQTIVVVTGDSDFIPAFKFARREGVRVVLCHLGHGVKRELRAHTDAVLDLE